MADFSGSVAEMDRWDDSALCDAFSKAMKSYPEGWDAPEEAVDGVVDEDEPFDEGEDDMRAADDRFEALLEVATDRTGSATPAVAFQCPVQSAGPESKSWGSRRTTALSAQARAATVRATGVGAARGAAAERSTQARRAAALPAAALPRAAMPDLADGMGDLLAAWYYCG
eukprot:CAMPEP_0184233652 /NCGR_PEP_ID=MMETSP0976-20121227/24411_1 /TAXON_ID=483370 /ORGANISM="non described non described, Strain CCMP2097" /LENGTH=169 /DNA_ID=CAMNT_0026538705 /DNA_START=21 /DNA_END=529 /DNA_ORIENTATION=-